MKPGDLLLGRFRISENAWRPQAIPVSRNTKKPNELNCLGIVCLSRPLPDLFLLASVGKHEHAYSNRLPLTRKIPTTPVPDCGPIVSTNQPTRSNPWYCLGAS